MSIFGTKLGTDSRAHRLARRFLRPAKLALGFTPTGLVWAGPILDQAGYANVSRNFLLGMARTGVRVRAVLLDKDHSDLLPAAVAEVLRNLRHSRAGGHPVEIIHYQPGPFPVIRPTVAPAVRIGCTIFETDRIPESWIEPCNAMDEIWVPSAFNWKTFASSGVQREKLRVVPYSVDTDYFRPISDVYEIPGRRSFCFLYVSFWDWRKGFDLLLRAYVSEFDANEDVSLVIRTNDPTSDAPQSSEALRNLLLTSAGIESRYGVRLPHIVVLAHSLTQSDLRRLYNSCDLYISTDLANGWGMPCMEAMAMGKPAATIDWSGSTQFMKSSNSLLIRPTGRLEPVDERLAAARPIYRGHQWAEVTVEEVRRVMRLAFRERQMLSKVAAQGMADIRRDYSLEAGARRILTGARQAAKRKSLYARLRRRILRDSSTLAAET